MFIFVDPTLTVKWKTVIKVLFLCFNFCLGVKFDNLMFIFTPVSFLINNKMKNLSIQNQMIIKIEIISNGIY